MVFVDSRVDEARKLGAGAVKQANIADRAIGSRQHGTLDLGRAVGTLTDIDVGTLLGGFGSFGTHAGAHYRGGRGSFTRYQGPAWTEGTLRSGNAPNIGSQRGSLPLSDTRGSLDLNTRSQGSLDVVTRTRGSLSAADRLQGTLDDARVPLLGDLRGSLDLPTETFGSLDLGARSSGSLDIVTRTRGSLSLPNRTQGTLGGNRYAGSPPQAHSADLVTSGTFPSERLSLADSDHAYIGSVERGGVSSMFPFDIGTGQPAGDRPNALGEVPRPLMSKGTLSMFGVKMGSVEQGTIRWRPRIGTERGTALWYSKEHVGTLRTVHLGQGSITFSEGDSVSYVWGSLVTIDPDISCLDIHIVSHIR